MWLNAWRTLPGALDEEGLLKWEETFLDGSFAPAKRGSAVGKTKRGKGTKWMVLVDDPLRQRLKKRGMERIAPYRKNNQGPRRNPRRYKRRWIVEQTNA